MKIVGLVIAFVGISLTFLDLRGAFVDDRKQQFGAMVLGSPDPIPRATPGFEAFLRDFPPPAGVLAEQVSHIGDKSLRWDTSPVENLAVVYVVNGERTASVARPDEVERWANATIYGWISLGVTVLGWVIVLFTDLKDMAKQRDDSDRPPWLTGLGRHGVT